MRAKRTSKDKQFKLVKECRASGLTDYQWCLENDIKPGTFYMWITRLKREDWLVPDPSRRINCSCITGDCKTASY